MKNKGYYAEGCTIQSTEKLKELNYSSEYHHHDGEHKEFSDEIRNDLGKSKVVLTTNLLKKILNSINVRKHNKIKLYVHKDDPVFPLRIDYGKETAVIAPRDDDL